MARSRGSAEEKRRGRRIDGSVEENSQKDDMRAVLRADRERMLERFREEAHIGGRPGRPRAAPSEIAAHAVQHDIEEDPRAR